MVVRGDCDSICWAGKRFYAECCLNCEGRPQETLTLLSRSVRVLGVANGRKSWFAMSELGKQGLLTLLSYSSKFDAFNEAGRRFAMTSDSLSPL